MRQGCINSPHLFNVYTDAVIREAEVEELGIKTGGKLVYNLRYEALCATSQEKTGLLIGKGNNRKSKTTASKCEKAQYFRKLERYMPMQALQQIVNQLKWLNFSFKDFGSLKSADGNCKNYIRSGIGMVKEIMLDRSSTDIVE